MDLQKLTVGQMAELNHVSEQTLRLYDREGLLKPRLTDERTGYRYYHILQSARLDLIQNLKVYGMTLRQIRDFLERDDGDKLRHLLAEQAGQMEERIAQLDRSLRAIRRAMKITRDTMLCPKTGKYSLNS